MFIKCVFVRVRVFFSKSLGTIEWSFRVKGPQLQRRPAPQLEREGKEQKDHTVRWRTDQAHAILQCYQCYEQGI
jgi:hypothetical protein